MISFYASTLHEPKTGINGGDKEEAVKKAGTVINAKLTLTIKLNITK